MSEKGIHQSHSCWVSVARNLKKKSAARESGGGIKYSRERSGVKNIFIYDKTAIEVKTSLANLDEKGGMKYWRQLRSGFVAFGNTPVSCDLAGDTEQH